MIAGHLDLARIKPDSHTRVASAPAEPISTTTPIRKALRKFWLQLHFYVGLIAGGLFVLSSLTGSLLVFYKTIDGWLNPEQRLIRPAEAIQPLERIVAAARTPHPEWPHPDNLTFPLHDRDTFQAWFRVPGRTPDEFHWHVVTVDPYNGRVLSERQWGTYLVSFVYELHKSLLLNETGEVLVGIVACLLMLSAGSGLYLWWPTQGNWRRACSFKPGTSIIRRHYDLHKLAGVVSAIALLLLAGTGIYLAFPGAVVPIVKLFSPVRDEPVQTASRPAVPAGIDPLPLEQVTAIAQRTLPEAAVTWLGFPAGAEGLYSVGLRQPGEVRETEGQSQVWIDPYSGAVLHVQDWRHFTGGETLVAWLFPLHNGEALGLTGRWIVFATGFVPPLLYVTALRMWWLKRRARLRQRHGASHTSAAADPRH